MCCQERLYGNASEADLKRNRLKREVEAEATRECTFQPDLTQVSNMRCDALDMLHATCDSTQHMVSYADLLVRFVHVPQSKVSRASVRRSLALDPNMTREIGDSFGEAGSADRRADRRGSATSAASSASGIAPRAASVGGDSATSQHSSRGTRPSSTGIASVQVVDRQRASATAPRAAIPPPASAAIGTANASTTTPTRSSTRRPVALSPASTARSTGSSYAEIEGQRHAHERRQASVQAPAPASVPAPAPAPTAQRERSAPVPPPPAPATTGPRQQQGSLADLEARIQAILSK